MHFKTLHYHKEGNSNKGGMHLSILWFKRAFIFIFLLSMYVCIKMVTLFNFHICTVTVVDSDNINGQISCGQQTNKQSFLASECYKHSVSGFPFLLSPVWCQWEWKFLSTSHLSDTQFWLWARNLSNNFDLKGGFRRCMNCWAAPSPV